ncbi:MAG TPA: hypothetical protein VJ571_04805 [Candidatus Nitrosotalea sp.]|nr:hypothetical protein [Candidatus Nitrosotalea sp.]
MKLPPIQSAGFAEKVDMKNVWKRFLRTVNQTVHMIVHLIQNL